MQSLLSSHRPQATQKTCLNSHNRVHGRTLVSVEGGDCSKRSSLSFFARDAEHIPMPLGRFTMQRVNEIDMISRDLATALFASGISDLKEPPLSVCLSVFPKVRHTIPGVELPCLFSIQEADETPVQRCKRSTVRNKNPILEALLAKLIKTKVAQGTPRNWMIEQHAHTKTCKLMRAGGEGGGGGEPK